MRPPLEDVPMNHPNAFAILHIPLDDKSPVKLPEGEALPHLIGYSLAILEDGMYIIEPKILFSPTADYEEIFSSGIKTLERLWPEEQVIRMALELLDYRLDFARIDSANTPVEIVFENIIDHLNAETDAPSPFDMLPAIQKQLLEVMKEMGFEEITPIDISLFHDESEEGANHEEN